LKGELRYANQQDNIKESGQEEGLQDSHKENGNEEERCEKDR